MPGLKFAIGALRGRGLVFVDRQVRAPAALVDCLLAVLGVCLLNALAEAANAAGFERLSLSVAAENPARRL